MRKGFLPAILLIAALLLGISGFSPAAPPLPDGRSYDQAHDSGLIDWNGPVQYVLLNHRDATTLPPDEGGASCESICSEWVTRIANGGTVGGSFVGDVAYFEVMVAFSHDAAAGSFVLQACSASQSASVYLGSGGNNLPGFITVSLAVPAGCPAWSLSAARGYVDFRSVDVDYATIFPTITPTRTRTLTRTATARPTSTSTRTKTRTATSLPTFTSTRTSTATLLPTFTATVTPSYTPTFTPTATLTTTATWTQTPSLTPTFTPTETFTLTATTTATLTLSPTVTSTPLPPVIPSADILCDRWGKLGWCVENARLRIVASDPQGFPVTVSGTAGQLFTCGASCTVALPEGTGTATFTASSRSGCTASGSLGWQYDASLPNAMLHLNRSAGLNGWHTSAVTVSGLGTDAISGIAALEIRVNGGGWQPAATLSDGVYRVQSRSVDNAGLEMLSAMQLVKVDTVKPTLAMILAGEKGGADFFHSAVTVSLSATDSGSGVARVEYRLDGGNWVQAERLPIAAEGGHGLEGRVTDNAGNVTWQAISVHIDTIPPLAVFVIPAPNSSTTASGTVPLGGSASDVGSGVARVEISFNEGQTWQTLSLVNDIWHYDWKTANLPDGRYRVTVRAWDVAGNVQTPGVSVVLRVDNRVPDKATLTIPLATVSPTPTVTATATRQPTQTVTATRKPAATSTPVPAPPLKAKPLPLWPIVGLIGLLLALASASLTDRRPHALRRIAQTFHQIVAQKKLDDGQ